MAKYEHLAIYKKSLELAVYMETAVKGFSRYHKYTIGAALRKQRQGACNAGNESKLIERKGPYSERVEG